MTSSKTQLLALADVVEGLDGPCRETDREIYKWLNCKLIDDVTYINFGEDSGRWLTFKLPRIWPWTRVFRYTASLDAATTLIPNGMGFHLNRYWITSHDGPVWSCEITTGGTPDRPRQVFECFDAPSPAIPTAAAALRALAAGCE